MYSNRSAHLDWILAIVARPLSKARAAMWPGVGRRDVLGLRHFYVRAHRARQDRLGFGFRRTVSACGTVQFFCSADSVDGAKGASDAMHSSRSEGRLLQPVKQIFP